MDVTLVYARERDVGADWELWGVFSAQTTEEEIEEAFKNEKDALLLPLNAEYYVEPYYPVWCVKDGKVAIYGTN